jgi:AmiR/NasT family two-component response regulator
MTSCLVVESHSPGAPALASDLESVGIHIIGAAQRSNLVQEAVRLAPDVVVFHESSVSDALFDSAALLLATAPRPLVVFTNDPDVDKMRRALQAGIHAYEVNGYGVQRLRAVIHMAQLRFAHDQQLRTALADVSHRFEERKLVDRAKGILMRARQVSEDEAFRVLRAASMHSNQRVGQVSQQVIAAANYAEAVNRAGQLRMLSQRLVKLYALRATAPSPAPDDDLLDESCQRVDANLAALAKSLSKATYGDLIDAVQAPWTQLKSALLAAVDVGRLAEVDALAERVLLNADRLVTSLETTGMASSLHVINVSGRQRMLSQRVAKQALLAVLLNGEVAVAARAEADKARAAFEEALSYLNGVPLSTREIRESLDAAGRTWGAMTQALARVPGAAGQQALGEASEALLALFEQLTERYERSMQMLMG